MTLNYSHLAFFSVNAKLAPYYKECDIEAWSGKTCINLSCCNKNTIDWEA